MVHRVTRKLNLEQLEEAASLIRAGGLVVFPTETVYGLGANAFSPEAVGGIFTAKGRPQDNPLIVHIASLDQLDQVAAGMNRAARVLLEGLTPGPVTVILPRGSGLAPEVTAGKDTVGVRIPGSAVARRFLAACSVPVAAPSANRSGRPSPTSFAMAWAEMEGRVDAVIEGPDAGLGLESTIVWPQSDRVVHVLRPGGISPEALRALFDRAGLPEVELRVAGHLLGETLPAAPGTRYRHYSPKAAVRLFADAAGLADQLAGLGADAGACSLIGAELMPGAPRTSSPVFQHRSDYDSLEDYARHLYRELVEADHRGSRVVLAWLPPPAGLGLALRDRLERAAGKTG